MITCFQADFADDVWRMAAKAISEAGDTHRQHSRLGWTRELLHCAFSIQNPRARWIFSRAPAINPAFAIVETLWILGGRNDSKLVNYWNPALSKYAGESEIYEGAYGHRLRKRFRLDQIEAAYAALAGNPETRQVVLQIWDPTSDLPRHDGIPAASDIPCNVCSILKVRGGHLEWMQILRSNDLFRGVPYNIVQFTILQEVMAGWLGIEPGTYNHISDSLHVYEEDLDAFGFTQDRPVICPDTSLAIPKSQFDHVLEDLLLILDRLSAEDLTPNEFMDVCTKVRVPTSYRDLLMIAAADSARRRGWKEHGEWAEKSCTQQSLRQIWLAWAARTA